MKEELSGLIGELKNDVDDKGTKIEEDRKAIQFSKITRKPNSICISQLFPQNSSRKSVFLTGKPRRQLLRRSTMNSKRSGRSLRQKVFSVVVDFLFFVFALLLIFVLSHGEQRKCPGGSKPTEGGDLGQAGGNKQKH